MGNNRLRTAQRGTGMAAAVAAALTRDTGGNALRGALPGPVRLQLAAEADRLGPTLSVVSRVLSSAARVARAGNARGTVFSPVITGDQLSVAGLADEELVRRCQAGDQSAFTEIVERYKDRVYGLVRRMVGSPEDEDITQDVFLRAFQALPGLRAGATLRTWLFRIAHNLCLTELKRRARRGAQVPLDEESEEQVHRLLSGDCGRDGYGRFEEQLDRREFAGEVRRMVGKLPARHRAALTLFYLEQAKYEEIAGIMGIPLGTVKTYIHRARLQLRDLVLAEMDPVYLSGHARPGEAPSCGASSGDVPSADAEDL